MTVEQAVLKFKIELLKEMPFWGDIVTRLQFVPREDIPTAATDGLTVYYSPAFFGKLQSTDAINFVLLHEVMHILLSHPSRCGEKDPVLWNVACDMVVNTHLSSLQREMIGAGIPFNPPPDALYFPSRYPRALSLSAEEVYNKHVFHIPGSQSNGGYVQVNIKGSFISGRGPYTVDTRGDLLPPPEENDDTSSSSASTAPSIEATVESIIQDAAVKARSQNPSFRIPTCLSFLFQTKTKLLNWKTLLRDYLSETIDDDSSYSTPERKYLHMDLILPGHCLVQNELDEVWAFIDSSGSVSGAEMNQFITQLCRIVKEFKCILHLAYWDTSVTDVYRNLRTEKQILSSPPHHSGGTDINCVYQYIAQNKLRPGVLLILTDGHFGTLQAEYHKHSLKSKTVLVLSQMTMLDNIKSQNIGKIATL